MRSLAVACLVSACGGTTAIPPSPVAAVPEPAASLPRADYVVVPAELLDPQVLDRIPHRARVRHIGASSMREAGPPTERSSKKSDVNLVLPVIDESRAKIRVVFEDDNARLALWIAKTDVWDTLAIPVALSDREGKMHREAGIHARQGAPLTLATQHAGLRMVQIRDPSIKLVGFVPERVLAKVWIAGEGDRPSLDASHDSRWDPPKDARPRAVLKTGTQLRAAPDATSTTVATIDSADVIGAVTGERGEFRAIEIVRPFARARGFVLASELTATTDDLRTHGTGRGHGFGMSHADKIDVPPGTCLFDRVDGEVVGVQSVLSTRLGRARIYDTPKWSMLHVGTNWSTVTVYIRDTSADPKQQKWESCTQPSHR